jgi:hypothetical protein
VRLHCIRPGPLYASVHHLPTASPFCDGSGVLSRSCEFGVFLSLPRPYLFLFTSLFVHCFSYLSTSLPSAFFLFCAYTDVLVSHFIRARTSPHLKQRERVGVVGTITSPTRTPRAGRWMTTLAQRTERATQLRRRVPTPTRSTPPPTHTIAPIAPPAAFTACHARGAHVGSVTSPPTVTVPGIILPRLSENTAGVRIYDTYPQSHVRRFLVPGAAPIGSLVHHEYPRSSPTVARRMRLGASPTPHLPPPTLLIAHVPFVASPRAAPDFSSMHRPSASPAAMRRSTVMATARLREKGQFGRLLQLRTIFLLYIHKFC